jgi:hypothetical protein
MGLHTSNHGATTLACSTRRETQRCCPPYPLSNVDTATPIQVGAHRATVKVTAAAVVPSVEPCRCLRVESAGTSVRGARAQGRWSALKSEGVQGWYFLYHLEYRAKGATAVATFATPMLPSTRLEPLGNR